MKISSGIIVTIWVENSSQNEKVETQAFDWLYDSCPTSLKHASVGPSTFIRRLTIRKLPRSPDTTGPSYEAKSFQASLLRK